MLISVLVMLNNINTLILSHFLKRIQYDQLCEILKFHTIFLIFTFHFQILLSYSFFLLLKKEYAHPLHLTNDDFVKCRPTSPQTFQIIINAE